MKWLSYFSQPLQELAQFLLKATTGLQLSNSRTQKRLVHFSWEQKEPIVIATCRTARLKFPTEVGVSKTTFYTTSCLQESQKPTATHACKQHAGCKKQESRIASPFLSRKPVKRYTTHTHKETKSSAGAIALTSRRDMTFQMLACVVFRLRVLHWCSPHASV